MRPNIIWFASKFRFYHILLIISNWFLQISSHMKFYNASSMLISDFIPRTKFFTQFRVLKLWKISCIFIKNKYIVFFFILWFHASISRDMFYKKTLIFFFFKNSFHSLLHLIFYITILLLKSVSTSKSSSLKLSDSLECSIWHSAMLM